MNKLKIVTSLLALCFIISITSWAQIPYSLKRKAQNKVEQEANKAVDQALNGSSSETTAQPQAKPESPSDNATGGKPCQWRKCSSSTATAC